MAYREFLQQALLSALTLSFFLYMIKTELLKRDVGNLVLDTELVKRSFATELLKEMEHCMNNTESVCCESKISVSDTSSKDGTAYENCSGRRPGLIQNQKKKSTWSVCLSVCLSSKKYPPCLV